MNRRHRLIHIVMTVVNPVAAYTLPTGLEYFVETYDSDVALTIYALYLRAPVALV